MITLYSYVESHTNNSPPESAYTASTLISLGFQAKHILPDGFLGITTFSVGDVWTAIGFPAGLFLWLMGFWFSAVSTVSCIYGWKKCHFTLNYWAFIFPNAGLTIAAIQIGDVLDSAGIKAVTSAMTIVLVAVWFYVAVMTVRAVLIKQVLWPGRDEDEEDIEGHEKDEAIKEA